MTNSIIFQDGHSHHQPDEYPIVIFDLPTKNGYFLQQTVSLPAKRWLKDLTHRSRAKLSSGFMDGASKLHPYSVIFSIIGSQGATNSFQSTLVSFLNFLAMFFPKYLTVLQCCIQFVCARIHDFVASFLKQNVVLGTP